METNLHDFGVDLTAQARAGRLDPVFGREAEIGRVMRILARKTKNNPVLLGDPGVGKTAVVEGLAQRMAIGDVPADLARMSVFSLNLGNLLAGTGYRGDFEQRLRDVVNELRKPGSGRLLFVDELHLLGKAGRSEGGLDAGNLLKPLLARGELPCIGASTPDEWQELVSRDPALERRFQPVEVREPSPDQALEILRGLRYRYEQHHGVEITDDALRAAVQRSAEVAPNRRLPDRAVDLLDEACAMLRLEQDSAADPRIADAQRRLAGAQARFDLSTFARVRYRVLPALCAARRPRLDVDAIERVCAGTMASKPGGG
jgi:ATP-dependent Clp protease ATP-binding subunit ClpB